MRAAMMVVLASIQLVGAAGFEPATWSTQNSRATRLRYAPEVPRIYRGPGRDTRFNPAPAASWAAEHGMRDPRAGPDAWLLGGAADPFQHRRHGGSRRDDLRRFRLGVLGDPRDAAVGVDEDHVERDQRVLHPHGHRHVLLEIEQHAAAFRQLLAEH